MRFTEEQITFQTEQLPVPTTFTLQSDVFLACLLSKPTYKRAC